MQNNRVATQGWQALFDALQGGRYAPAQTDDELWEITRELTGIEIPRVAVCPGHSAPFEAFKTAYFARHPVVVWLASRGFGGKSVLLAALSMVEAITYGASVALLGGSGEQSKRIHEYMKGEEPNLPNKFWKWAGAPADMLVSDPTSKETKLNNYGRIRALTASQASVRGPHPQRLRLDEVDEMDLKIFNASMGQTMEARGIMPQTVCSSTHQYPNGTFTEVLKMSVEKGWPVYRWCWKETSRAWLSERQIEQKRQEVTTAMWGTEYDLTEPTSTGRSIMPDKVVAMFKRSLGEYKGGNNEYIELEPPDPNGTYSTGGDWAKRRDWSTFITFRTDVFPFRLVAFRRVQRRSWPDMIATFEEQATRYPGEAMHDATGIGDVIDDYLDADAFGVVLRGGKRERWFSQYIMAIERGDIEAPYIESMFNEHYYLSHKDLGGVGHPPDTFIAGVLAYAGTEGWVRGSG